MKTVDARDVEVLTEWCRNKPEDAAIEILALQARVGESNSSDGGYCKCGRWIPSNES